MPPPDDPAPETITPLVDAMWRSGYRVAYRMMRLWWYVRRPALRGAFVAIWIDGRLLVIRNSYRGGATVPCGGIRRQEEPIEAACRELAEEVGIRLRPDQLRPACELEIPYEHTIDRSYFFEYEPVEADLEIQIAIDRREVIWADFIPEGDLRDMDLVPQLAGYLDWRGA